MGHFLSFFLLTQTRKNQLFVFVNSPLHFTPESLLLYRAHTYTHTRRSTFFFVLFCFFFGTYTHTNYPPLLFFFGGQYSAPPLLYNSQSIGSADWLGVHVYTAFFFCVFFVLVYSSSLMIILSHHYHHHHHTKLLGSIRLIQLSGERYELLTLVGMV